jgi:hypothetical protein
MRIHKLIITAAICFTGLHSFAQSEQPEKYRKFSLYAGVGPSWFFNNLTVFQNDVNCFNWEFSFRAMWEPQHSFLSLGIESGYYRLYTVNSTVSTGSQTTSASVKNSSIPIQLVVSMKLSKKMYASWSMGQSVLISKVNAEGINRDFNSHSTSLSDFTATVGYRFVQKTRISYSAEFKGYYSSSYANGTISLVFIVGFKL